MLAFMVTSVTLPSLKQLHLLSPQIYLNSVLLRMIAYQKQRHYFPTKIRLVKARVFPLVMYG